MADEEEKPTIRDWVFALFSELIGLIVFFPIIIALIYWAFWWDHPKLWNNDIIAYPLICSKDYKDGKCLGNQTKGDTITFRVRVERGEVVIMTKKGTPPLTLTKCSIFDTENWECSYGKGSKKVFFVDGLRINNNPKVKYVSQWQYRWSGLKIWAAEKKH